MKKYVSIILLLFAINCYADASLHVTTLTNDVQLSTELGQTTIEGVGVVTLTARKNGKQIVIHAQNASHKIIGKAEAVIGLKETPIYVMSSKGLKKITIYWDSSDK